MPRFVRWMQVIWSWRNHHPTASCVVTGLWGVFGLLAGIVSVAGHAIGSGVFLSLIGAGLLGLVIYAGYDTDWFQNWKYKDTGRAVEGHMVKGCEQLIFLRINRSYTLLVKTLQSDERNTSVCARREGNIALISPL